VLGGGEGWHGPIRGEAVEVEAPQAELYGPEDVSPEVVHGLEGDLVVVVAVGGRVHSAIDVWPSSGYACDSEKGRELLFDLSESGFSVLVAGAAASVFVLRCFR
jgi:hypothetical protein